MCNHRRQHFTCTSYTSSWAHTVISPVLDLRGRNEYGKTCRFSDIPLIWLRIQSRSAYKHNNNGECCGVQNEPEGGEKERRLGGITETERKRERETERGREESNERILKLCANKIRGHLHLRWDWVAGVTMATFPRVFKRSALPDSGREKGREKENERKKGARYKERQHKERHRAEGYCGVQAR